MYGSPGKTPHSIRQSRRQLFICLMISGGGHLHSAQFITSPHLCGIISLLHLLVLLFHLNYICHLQALYPARTLDYVGWTGPTFTPQIPTFQYRIVLVNTEFSNLKSVSANMARHGGTVVCTFTARRFWVWTTDYIFFFFFFLHMPVICENIKPVRFVSGAVSCLSGPVESGQKIAIWGIHQQTEEVMPITAGRHQGDEVWLHFREAAIFINSLWFEHDGWLGPFCVFHVHWCEWLFVSAIRWRPVQGVCCLSPQCQLGLAPAPQQTSKDKQYNGCMDEVSLRGMDLNGSSVCKVTWGCQNEPVSNWFTHKNVSVILLPHIIQRRETLRW